VAKLKVPSLQHLARNWRNDPERISNVLVELVRNPPTFNYDPLFGALRELIVLGASYEQVEVGLRLRVKRPVVLKNMLEVLRLMRDHFDGLRPDFVQAVAPRYYPLGRGLLIPFAPPLIYGVNGAIRFPWFSFWRRNTLSDEGLSLFVTVVDELLAQDPDLEEADFHILDFSVPARCAERELRIINGREIERLTNERKMEMLSVFAEGYRRAEVVLATMPVAPESRSRKDDTRDDDQLGLFPEI
jgi:hypothetical protein